MSIVFRFAPIEAWPSHAGFILAGAPQIFGFVFITTPVALHAVFVVVDAFFKVFFPDLGTGMLMTAVASVISEVIVDMTGRTFSIVMTIKPEIIIMLKGSWFPMFLRMTGTAIRLALLVKGVDWSTMATVALVPHRLLQ